MFAYKHGKALRWDCTYVGTFASTHVNESAVRFGSTETQLGIEPKILFGFETMAFLVKPGTVIFSCTFAYSSIITNFS